MKMKEKVPTPATPIGSYDEYVRRFLPDLADHVDPHSSDHDQDPREIGARMARESLRAIGATLHPRGAA
jgi:hypothetical protein